MHRENTSVSKQRLNGRTTRSCGHVHGSVAPFFYAHFFKDYPVALSLQQNRAAGIFKRQRNIVGIFHKVIFWVMLQSAAHLSVWLIGVIVRGLNGQMEYFKIKRNNLNATESKI